MTVGLDSDLGWVGGYRLLGRLGGGSMGDAFLAGRPSRIAAAKLQVIKTLHQRLAAQQEFVDLFVQEGRVAAALNHPNIVQTFEVGEDHGVCFLVLEYLDGQSFAAFQGRAANTNTPIPLELSVGILIAVLRALHHLHELRDLKGTPLGLVHRDVNPRNIMLTYDGVPKLMDFGVVHASHRGVQMPEEILLGTSDYMAPEIALAEAIDRRADLFAVGIMLWEALVGRRFWRDVATANLLDQVRSRSLPPPPRTVSPRIPTELDEVCRRALAPRAEGRYPSADAMAEPLEAWLAAQRVPDFTDALSQRLRSTFAVERELAGARAIAATNVLLGISPAAMPKVQPGGRVSAPRMVAVRPVHADTIAPPPVGAPRSDPPRTSEPNLRTKAPLLPRPTLEPSVERPASNKAAKATSKRRATKRGALGYALVALGASLLTALVTILALGSGRPTSSTTYADAGATPQRESVRLSITITPDTARLYVDDRGPLPATHIAEVPRDGRRHVIRATMDGYDDLSIPATADQDQQIRLAFVVSAPTSSGPEKRPSPAPPRASSSAARPTPPLDSRLESNPFR